MNDVSFVANAAARRAPATGGCHRAGLVSHDATTTRSASSSRANGMSSRPKREK